MISTNHLIHSIPSYIIDSISTRILGDATDANVLATWLNDPARLKDVFSAFTQSQRRILFDLYELGGQAQWSVLTKIYHDKFDDIKGQLKLFGSYGLVYQGGLSGRDPVILLPSLIPLLEDVQQIQDGTGHELVWTNPPDISIWDHIVLLNTIRAEKIRCRSGMEPFKKGWQLLDDKLDKAIETRKIYWELVELGCIRGIKGQVTVQNAAAVSLAMEGDLRLKIWRFFQLCKPYPGLEGLLFRVLDNQGTAKSRVERTIYLFLINHFKNLTNEESLVSEIVSNLKDQGVIQEDSTQMWLRLLPEVHVALKTGDADKTGHAYKEEVIIQPNMEILVPGDFDPLDHLHVAEVADIVRADVVSIYRITRASIYRALQTGWNYTMIERLLGRISQRSVPDNVLKNVSLWSRALRRAHVIKGTFLVLQDAKPKPEWTLEEILPGIYRIPERHEHDLESYLDENLLIIRNGEDYSDEERDINWGKKLPIKVFESKKDKPVFKEGVYPFGMVKPLPYGSRGEKVFEQAIQDGQSLTILYPKHGYGAIQVKKIIPIYVYRKKGIAFVEAFCEDSGEGEEYDITKIKALFQPDDN